MLRDTTVVAQQTKRQYSCLSTRTKKIRLTRIGGAFSFAQNLRVKNRLDTKNQGVVDFPCSLALRFALAGFTWKTSDPLEICVEPGIGDTKNKIAEMLDKCRRCRLLLEHN
jgi:hypothetical protein